MKTIVCLGDSVTCNWEQPSYTDHWQQLIDQANLKYRIINAGINGETAQDGYYRLDRDVLNHQPDLVTVMFGHNEINRGLAVSHCQQYLNLIIQHINHSLPRAQIWILTPNRINHPQAQKLYQPLLKSLRQKDPRFTLVDIWKAYPSHQLDSIYTHMFDYDGVTGPDWLHPNQTGHRLIAEALMNQLTTS